MKRQRVSFHKTHNTDIKGAIVERINTTLKRPRRINISARIKTYRYVDVENKIRTVYNSVNFAIPNKICPSNIYILWQKLNSLDGKTPRRRVTFNWRFCEDNERKDDVCQRV